MNLKGHRNRKVFLKKYDITPISHQKIVEGLYKEGVGGTLTDHYYCFSYKMKGNGNNEMGTFNCGYIIAEDLLKLTNQEKLPLFNPLKLLYIEKEESKQIGIKDSKFERNKI